MEEGEKLSLSEQMKNREYALELSAFYSLL